MNNQETVNELVREAIKFLAQKNQVSEHFIMAELASLNEGLINQINDLVQSALYALWDEFTK